MKQASDENLLDSVQSFFSIHKAGMTNLQISSVDIIVAKIILLR